MTKARDIASAIPAPSTVDATELGYLDGVTSAIQTQIDAKTAKSTLTTTGDIYYASSASTPARLGIGSTGNVLTVASGIPSWAAPAGGGKVLQVVNATTSTEVTIASTTMTDTGLTATITPTLATSKILILTSQVQALVRDSQNIGGNTRLMRGATELFSSRQVLNMTLASTDTALVYQLNFSYLDSPSTTSATTYKTQGKVTTTANSSTNRFNETLSSITLLEIGV